MLQGKRFGSNGDVIAETEAYFEAKANGIEIVSLLRQSMLIDSRILTKKFIR